MTFNLKSRPVYKGQERHILMIHAYEKWFEGFKKRQQFLISKNEQGILHIAVLLHNHGKLGLDPVQAIEWFIRKEILGDE